MNQDDLVWANIKLVDSVAREVGLDPALVSEIGLDALFQAAESYQDSERGNFSSYARKRLKWRFNDFRKYSLPAVNLENEIYNLADDTGQKDDSTVFTEGDIADLHSALTPDELYLLQQHYLQHRTLQSIGDELGIAKQTVSYRLEKIREKL